MFHRHLENLRRLRRTHDSDTAVEPWTEPTVDDVRREYDASPVNEQKEVTELVGLCLRDVFSDNHDVITADGRLADIGSFRSAGAFLDAHLTRHQEGWPESDYLRFYLGTISISRRADMTSVYAMIFRRLAAAGADRVYHFPELALIEPGSTDDGEEFGVAGSRRRARGTTPPCRHRARPGGTARHQCSCTRGRDGSARPDDSRRVPCGVRRRPAGLASRMRPPPGMPSVSHELACDVTPSAAAPAAQTVSRGTRARPGRP